MRRFLIGLLCAAIAFAGSVASATPSSPSTRWGGAARIFGPSTVNAHTCVLTDIYTATPGALVVWILDSTTTATATIKRTDSAAVDHTQGSTINVTANVESANSAATVLYQSRVNICNTTAGSGTITVDADERK